MVPHPGSDADVTRVAAIDCGTNTIRLLVADRRGDDLVDVRREMRVVRLGEGVDRTGVLGAEGLRRTETALREYAGLLRADGAQAVRMVATSATRDAHNRADFRAMVRGVLGVDPDVVTGEEEAHLTFTGGVRGLDDGRPSLVVDIGGGSTEFVLGRQQVDAAVSVDIGSVRLTERWVRADPPAAADVEAARGEVREALRTVRDRVAVPDGVRIVGVAGTVTTLVAMTLGLPTYDSAAIHHAVVPADRLLDTVAWTVAADRAARAAVPSMHPGRVDVIAMGAVILGEVVTGLGAGEVTASETDILDGIALSVAAPSR